ncbi:hypothetical protein R3P38DRAFT_3212830 [Favolaschia claudopus]|uniref:Uncharacterized protein n=1 Tax=Favolaschia claudopus TaxID=2862362 RepID=A0AAW0AEG6_9AGAR
MNSISNLNRVTGKEHDQISRFILGIIVDIQLPDNLPSSRLIGAIRVWENPNLPDLDEA